MLERTLMYCSKTVAETILMEMTDVEMKIFIHHIIVIAVVIK